MTMRAVFPTGRKAEMASLVAFQQLRDLIETQETLLGRLKQRVGGGGVSLGDCGPPGLASEQEVVINGASGVA